MEHFFNIFKSKLSSLLETAKPDQQKTFGILLNQEQFNNDLSIKKEDVKQKAEKLKEKMRKIEHNKID